MKRNYQPSTYRLLFKPVTLPISLATVKEHLKIDASDTSQDTYLTILINSVVSFAEDYTKRDLLTKKYRTYIDCFFEPVNIKKSKLIDIDSIKYLKDGVLTTVSDTVYYFTDDNDFADILLEDSASFPSDVDSKRQAIHIEFYAGFGIKVDSADLVSNVVTITTVENHYLTSGQTIVISGANESLFNGEYIISVTGDKTFTYAKLNADLPATGTLFANDIPSDLAVAMLQHISRIYENRGDCDAGNAKACDISSGMNLPAETKQIYTLNRIYEISPQYTNY